MTGCGLIFSDQNPLGICQDYCVLLMLRVFFSELCFNCMYSLAFQVLVVSRVSLRIRMAKIFNC